MKSRARSGNRSHNTRTLDFLARMAHLRYPASQRLCSYEWRIVELLSNCCPLSGQQTAIDICTPDNPCFSTKAILSLTSYLRKIVKMTKMNQSKRRKSFGIKGWKKYEPSNRTHGNIMCRTGCQ